MRVLVKNYKEFRLAAALCYSGSLEQERRWLSDETPAVACAGEVRFHFAAPGRLAPARKASKPLYWDRCRRIGSNHGCFSLSFNSIEETSVE